MAHVTITVIAPNGEKTTKTAKLLWPKGKYLNIILIAYGQIHPLRESVRHIPTPSQIKIESVSTKELSAGDLHKIEATIDFRLQLESVINADYATVYVILKRVKDWWTSPQPSQIPATSGRLTLRTTLLQAIDDLLQRVKITDLSAEQILSEAQSTHTAEFEIVSTHNHQLIIRAEFNLKK